MIKNEQEQTRTNTIAIGFQGTPWLKLILDGLVNFRTFRFADKIIIA